MNPSGYRLEEKKEQDRPSFGDSKSVQSYKSTHSSRSSVLERAREYNRRIEETRRRAKSLERTPSTDAVSDHEASPRSRSVGRAPQNTQQSTRERAMASVRRDSSVGRSPPGAGTTSSPPDLPRGRSSTSPRHPPSPVYQQQQQQQPPRPKASPGRLMRNHQSNNNNHQPPPEQEAVVSPELLVDALSGHEDGLLAIAEKLMEHYDAGYDVMGEAIIDAFADVQKLFQHVVEAAHMEGAAFEASRRQEEMAELRRQAAAGELSPHLLGDVPSTPEPQSPNGPIRHDEFVDQDVKDVLTEAIRQGTALREQHQECLRLYEQACQSASALLPVDSDHRGRLQLSLARAESMQADRACAILRYAMDDVLRSAMRAGRTPLPDPSKRADVVLSRPSGNATMNSLGPAAAGVIQSSDEALASLMDEMKEIMAAPVYKDTPLQQVAQRFWTALTDAQKNQQRNAEKLEQALGKLKGEFLLARAEWEEKLTKSHELADAYKTKYERLKEVKRGEEYMDAARSTASSLHPDTSMRSGASVASLGSGLAIHAKNLVKSINDFNCVQPPAGGVSMETAELEEERRRRRRLSPRRSAQKSPASSRAYQEYARSSPQRMDV